MFTAATIVAEAHEQISHAAITRGFAIPAYCFMPDHLHLLVEGQADNSDLIRFANLLKQRTSFVYQRNHPNRLWQKGYFEHVLRDEEVTRVVAKYILENPVRAGLVKEPLDYPYSGSLVFSREQLLDLWRGGTP